MELGFLVLGGVGFNVYLLVSTFDPQTTFPVSVTRFAVLGSSSGRVPGLALGNFQQKRQCRQPALSWPN